MSYNAYGELLSQSGWTFNPFRWVGRQCRSVLTPACTGAPENLE